MGGREGNTGPAFQAFVTGGYALFLLFLFFVFLPL